MDTPKNRPNGLKEPKAKAASPKVKAQRSPVKIILKIFFSLILLVLSLAIMVGSAAGGLLMGGVYGIIKTTPVLDPNILKPTSLNSFVYDADGNIIAELKREENRVWIDYNDIPKMLINAYVAIEDKRFFEHNGIDFRRIGSAILSYAKHLSIRCGYRGRSTITHDHQDLTRMMMSIKRKFRSNGRNGAGKGLTKEEY
jgi:penicillin-binding protein 1A